MYFFFNLNFFYTTTTFTEPSTRYLLPRAATGGKVNMRRIIATQQIVNPRFRQQIGNLIQLANGERCNFHLFFKNGRKESNR